MLMLELYAAAGATSNMRKRTSLLVAVVNAVPDWADGSAVIVMAVPVTEAVTQETAALVLSSLTVNVLVPQ